MKDPEIDDLWRRAADGQPPVDPALVDRLVRRMGTAPEPVRPLAPQWMLTGGLVLVCVAMAAAGGLILGPHGVQKMDALEMAVIFPVLGALIWAAAALSAAEVVPGSRRPMAPWVLGVGGCLALAAVFGLLFHDYGTEQFVAQGIRCLVAGLVQAVPASAGTWWVLRRGFAVNSPAAGFVQGVLAGLAGVTMLEIHCPNFEVAHVIVWHIAVLPVSGGLGMLAAWMSRERAWRRAASG